MSILVVYGTRPEYIKVKPLIDEMRFRGIEFKTLFTGQHKDIAPEDADYNITMVDMSTERLNSVMMNCLNILDECFDGIKSVLVQGDTTSVVALAINAMHRKLKVIHLEAGLRSYDTENPFPEENNRRIVSTIASLHLCPTELNANNLYNEGINDDVYVVGNTVLDTLTPYKDKCEYKNKVLITLHRRENHNLIQSWFSEINKIALNNPEIEFILPIHPNPNVIKHASLLTNVTVCEPLSHDKLLDILVKCKLVITDSGGLQEECSFLNKKCLVCRKITERPESVGLTSFMVPHPNDLTDLFTYHIINYEVDLPSPYGNGTSSKKICDILTNSVDIVVAITSYDRFDHVKNIVDQLISQTSKYTVKIALINDGSIDDRYKIFDGYHNDLIYLTKENGGKSGYYETVNKLWAEVKVLNPKFVIQSDDDFILCDNFINTIMNEYHNEKKKSNKLVGLCPHIYSFDKESNNESFWSYPTSIDGIALLDVSVLKQMKYKINKPISNLNGHGVSVGFWQQISDAIKNSGDSTTRTNVSLVYHNNLGGSKLHTEFRKSKMIYTQKFIGVVPDDVAEYDRNFIRILPENIESLPFTRLLKHDRQQKKLEAQRRMLEYEKLKARKENPDNDDIIGKI